MKIKTMACTLVAAAFSISAANAAHVWEDPSGWWDSHWTVTRNANLFNAQEVTFDIFGSYMAGQRGIDEIFDTNIRSGHWGGGVGLNYFFTREIGIGVDANVPDNGGNFVDSVSASVIARFPLEGARLAPYIFGGGGRITEPKYQWGLHAGLGLEFRFNPMTGIFVDGRYVWADDAYDDDFGDRRSDWDGDHLLFRAGVRLAF